MKSRCAERDQRKEYDTIRFFLKLETMVQDYIYSAPAEEICSISRNNDDDDDGAANRESVTEIALLTVIVILTRCYDLPLSERSSSTSMYLGSTTTIQDRGEILQLRVSHSLSNLRIGSSECEIERRRDGSSESHRSKLTTNRCERVTKWDAT